ncbi:hypothetical protein [Sphingobacterium paucimobilis]|uniref:DUF4302 domain-containing protein n=1 Tax=Sphingobacterium paucimobilis HER1398 TaxID=1346330 RepID=U2JB41_9SPHI|nr:hypothetical protein [Sphingobacterium paucimobilis]ERJ59883.1 hypothetical protein M472_14015 [Sphingobacterium paucimobilis HER1398]
MRHFLITLILAIVFSCSKDITVLPEEETLTKEEAVQQHKDFVNKLVSNEQGWFMSIGGAESKDSTMLHLVFKADGEVLVKSTSRENLVAVTSTYQIIGDYKSILKFTENSIFGLLERIDDSPRELVFKDFSGMQATLARADGYNNNPITLAPFAESLQSVFKIKQDSVYALLDYEAAFALTKGLFRKMLGDNEEATKKRFSVFSFADRGFHWSDVDTVAKKISFEFVPPYNAVNPTFIKYKNTYSFDYFPGGMVFSPAITYGNVLVDSIFFDHYDENNKVLLLTKAGNLNNVEFGYANNEAHVYTGITKLFDVTAWPSNAFVYLLAGTGINSFSGRFSTLLNNARTTLRSDGTAIPANTAISFNIRINSSGTNGTGSMIQVYIPVLGNIFFKCDYVIEGKNILKIRNVAMTPQTPNAMYDNTVVRNLIIDMFGGDGFYISPTAGALVVTPFKLHLLDRNVAEDQISVQINENASNIAMMNYYDQYTR